MQEVDSKVEMLSKRFIKNWFSQASTKLDTGVMKPEEFLARFKYEIKPLHQYEQMYDYVRRAAFSIVGVQVAPVGYIIDNQPEELSRVLQIAKNLVV